MSELRHQMNLRIPKSVHLAARVKALQAGIDLSEVVRRLLQKWVAGEVVIDEPPPGTTVERS